MVVDGVLGFVVIWKLWHWRWWQAGLLIGPLVIVDAIYFSANLLKIFEGAWLPLLFGIAMVLLIITWRRGTDIVAGKTRGAEVGLESLVRSLERKPPHIVPGTAVFLTSDPSYAPTALMHNLKHNKVLHEHNAHPHDHYDRHATRGRGGSSYNCSGFAAVQPDRIEIWLCGNTERTESACACAEKGLDLRYYVDFVFPVPACAAPRGKIKHAAMAGPTIHWSCTQCERRHGLLSNSHRPGGRGGHTGRCLTPSAIEL